MLQIKLCHNLLIDMRGQMVQETDNAMTRPILAQTVSNIHIATVNENF